MRVKLTQPPAKGELVNEGDSCPCWEKCSRPCIAPMKECWFCKWSDFDIDAQNHQTQSTCRYAEAKKEGLGNIIEKL